MAKNYVISPSRPGIRTVVATQTNSSLTTMVSNVGVLNDALINGFTRFNSIDSQSGTIDSTALTYTAIVAPAGGVRSYDSYGSGKYYFEVTANVINSDGSDGIGISIKGQNYTTLAPSAGGGIMAYPGFAGLIFFNGGSTGSSIGSASSGDVIGVAFDATAKLIWFRRNTGSWNGSGTADPATATGGVSFSALTGPFYAVVTSGKVGTSNTANFGASTFAQPVPSGFTAGLPATLANQPGLPFDLLKRQQTRNQRFYEDEQLQDGWQDPRMRQRTRVQLGTPPPPVMNNPFFFVVS